MGIEVPPYILDRIAEGKSVLFLGAGASYGALDAKGRSTHLSGSDIASALSKRFLGGRRATDPLVKVADYAINEGGVADVQQYIRELFEPLQPAPFHKLIAKFRWRAIVTTNYDLLAERSYEQTPNRLQDPVPVIRNNDWKRALETPNSVPIIKLHGCISHSADTLIPLVISNEQYLKHRHGRERLSITFQELAKDYPVVFCGYDIADTHIQAVLFGLEEGTISRPQYLVINPTFDEFDERHWANHRVTVLPITYEAFLNDIDQKTPETRRVLGRLYTDSSGSLSKWLLAGKSPSRGLQELVSRQLEHVTVDLKTEAMSAERFYRGDSASWAPIKGSLDFRRSVVAALEASLTGEAQQAPSIILIKGHAGAGKSVALRRAAWDLAGEPFRKLVFYAGTSLEGVKHHVEELTEITGEHLYIFIDNLLYDSASVTEVLRHAQHRNLPITLVAGVRTNEWNVNADELGLTPDEEYVVGDLSVTEARSLCELLEKHNCLGELRTLSRDKQVEALMSDHERQLLVTLHEATLGKKLREIVLDEYRHITPTEAQILYLDICSLHRLGIAVRAGLISRLTGIRFEDFQSRFFKPLERVVNVDFDWKSRDYVYRARHRDIAQMVFQEVLGTPEERANQLARVVSGLNSEYSSDDAAASNLLKGRRLAEEFADRQLVDRIFTAASHAGLDASFVLQQQALFELSHPGGSKLRALALVDRALAETDNAPSSALYHTKAIVLRDLSRDPKIDEALHERYRIQALSLLREHGGLQNSYTAAGICEILLDQVRIRLQVEQEAATGRLSADAVLQKIEELERVLSDSRQRFPTDDHLANLEAKFHQTLSHNPRATQILREAFGRNQASEMTCLRLARQLSAVDREAEAIEILRSGVKANPGAKNLSFELARKLMIAGEEANAPEIEKLLRRSFTDGDTHFDAQFWYARHLYLYADRQSAHKMYEVFRRRPMPYVNISNRKGLVTRDGHPVVFQGTIHAIRGDYAFISGDSLDSSLFLHRNEFKGGEWNSLRTGDRIRFGLAFSYRGPACADAERIGRSVY